MRSPHTSTALALLFGLGVAVAGLPAGADQAAGQAAGGQEMTTGQQGGGELGAQPATGQEGTAGATGATAAGQEATAGTGMGDGEFVTGEDATARSGERFDELAEGQEGMTREQFAAGMTGAEDPEEAFGQIDRDGDGQISREEWQQWREQGFAEAAPEGQMTTQDYETWDRGGQVTGQ